MNRIATNIAAADDTLVARLKARDGQAMADLLHQHGSRLYAVALQIMRNETDAQEAVQDALLTIWNKIDSFENRSAFTTWLHRVAANAALMRLRKNKRFAGHVPLEVEHPDHNTPAVTLTDASAGPDTSLLNRELGERVRAAIEELAEPYRTTVILADVNELSMEQVAEATGATVAAVKSRLHRGRLSLRKTLAPYFRESN